MEVRVKETYGDHKKGSSLASILVTSFLLGSCMSANAEYLGGTGQDLPCLSYKTSHFATL